jgi:hypothetical protein
VVLTHGGGKKGNAVSLEKVKDACLSSLMEGDDENVRTAAAVCASALASFMDAEALCDMLTSLNEGGSVEVGVVCGKLLGTGAVLQTAGQRAVQVRDASYALLSKGLKDERAAVKVAACSALTSLFTVPPQPKGAEKGAVDVRKGEYRTAVQSALHAFANLLGLAASDAASLEVRKTAMSAIKQVLRIFWQKNQVFFYVVFNFI